jgi:hypothetical protein
MGKLEGRTCFCFVMNLVGHTDERSIKTFFSAAYGLLRWLCPIKLVDNTFKNLISVAPVQEILRIKFTSRM